MLGQIAEKIYQFNVNDIGQVLTVQVIKRKTQGSDELLTDRMDTLVGILEGYHLDMHPNGNHQLTFKLSGCNFFTVSATMDVLEVYREV